MLPDHLHVLQSYRERCRPSHVQALGSAGGFSGAQFWKVTAEEGTFCLRRWPQGHPSQEWIEFIQAVLWYVAREGFDLVPVPVPAHDRRGYVRHAGHLWELSPWMPGEADFCRQPTPVKLRAAISALARFHVAAAPFPLPEAAPVRSPGIVGRLARLREWVGGDLTRLAEAIEPGVWPELAARGKRILRLFPAAAPEAIERLAVAAEHQVTLQPCIRDIWHDHVLYEGDRVTGLIDFGSMQAESVAADVARLLGSMALDDQGLWQAGLDAYEAIRPLSPGERDLVTAFDRSTVLMAGLNWLDWVFRQRRRFEDRASVLGRVDAILLRLGSMAPPHRRM